ncbi:hypothetical protein, partial [Geobacillus stearothermophilus]|uniref:hypothetical protein n=1 Tax=Geobacillus stearothermophilus TaxID=1422 RepID=UPI00128F7A3E
RAFFDQVPGKAPNGNAPFFMYHRKNSEDSCKKNKNFGQKMSLTWYHKNIEKHIFLSSPLFSFVR